MNKTRILVESAVMIALSTVLSVFAVYKLPFGGSVTLLSQLPIILIAYRHKTRQGLFTGIILGAIQMILGADNFSYVSGIGAMTILAFSDYIAAFGVLGLGGIFRKRFNSPVLELALGCVISSLMRYLCHIISGVTIWSAYAPETQTVLHYSVAYNASYMIPELIITVAGAIVIGFTFDLLVPEIKLRKRSK